MSEQDDHGDKARTGARGQESGFDYLAYLQAKQAVDDAALNPSVYAAFERGLSQAQSAGRRPRLVEFGAGIGTMLLRLLRRGALRGCTYVMVDADAGFAERAINWLGTQVPELGLAWRATSPDQGVITGPGVQVEVRAIEAEALAWLAGAKGAAHDLALAHTFMDLVHPASFLAALVPAMRRGGQLWLTSTFAGHTAMRPAHPDDTELWAAYHDSMRARGGPRHAQALRAAIDDSQLQLIAHGRGDWQVDAQRASAAQRAFVGFILDTVQREPAVARALGSERLSGWLKLRRRQLAAAEFSFEAHQVDFLCGVPSQ